LSRVTRVEFSMQDVMRRLLQSCGRGADVRFETEMSAVYVDDWVAHVEFLHGIAPYLTRLSRRYRLGIITNTHYPPMVADLLRQMKVADLFDTVITSIEHGKLKPDPSIFEHAFDSMGIRPADAVYVGDSYEADYCGAVGVGMTCYLIGQHARVPSRYQIPSVFDLPHNLVAEPGISTKRQ
jgi:putative hydrolase of the HAD superfamily